MPARLEHPGLAPLLLDDSNGIRVLELDRGFPEVRDVADERTDADGDDDQTEHHGSAAVTLRLLIRRAVVGGMTVQQAVDRLGAFCHPRMRPYLYHWADGEPERRIRLRASQQSRPQVSGVYREVQAVWRAPDGVEEAAAETIAVIAAAADVEEGRLYNLIFNRVYPVSAPVGTVTVVNDGNVAANPILRLYGPCTDPRIENQTTGQALVFAGLVVAAGDYVELDVLERTVRLNGLVDQSRYTLLDFAVSQWWQLQPGPNAVRYFPVAFTAPSQAEIRFRSPWL